jgi:RNA-directed DNA polymerase
MSDKRQKNQLVLAFTEEGRSEAPKASQEGTESLAAKRRTESSAITEQLAVARPWQRKYLGFSFTLQREPQRRIAPKAILRFKERIRELTRRTRGVSVKKVAEELGRYLRGWQSYFGFCQTPYVLRNLDYWTRRRLRSFLWKQWKRGSVRFAELSQRGVDAELAAQTAGSAHGPWRLAASPGPHIARPTAYFVSLGIPQLFGTHS